MHNQGIYNFLELNICLIHTQIGVYLIVFFIAKWNAIININ